MSLLKLIRTGIALTMVGSVFVSYADSQSLLSNNGIYKQAQSPLSRYITIPFRQNFNFDYGANNGLQNLLQIEPSIPISLSQNWELVSRTIIPTFDQPSLTQANSAVVGLGDISPSFFFAPVTQNLIQWGVGPAFILPTATQGILGNGKWCAGPSLSIFAMPKHWVLGFITSNAWSFAGDNNRPPVSLFQFQYFVAYLFLNGWYVISSPVIGANWDATPAKNIWTVPLGLGLGKTFKIKKQAASLSLQALDYVASPVVGPNWSLILTFKILVLE